MEAVRVRDWLGELRSLLEADEDTQPLVLAIVEARPDLEERVYGVVAEYLGQAGEAWAVGLVKDARAAKLAGVTERLGKARLFIYPEPQPGDAKPKPSPQSDWKARFNQAIAAKPEPQAEEAKAQPEPEVEPETQAPAPVQLPAVVPPQPAKWDEAIDLLNTRHAIIDNVGGKTMIASWEPSPLDPLRMVVVFQSKESFLLRYSNRSVSVPLLNARGVSGTGSVPLGQWWLAHRGRRQFRGVTFLPRGEATVSGCLNLWRGWGVVEVQGDWSLIREHIAEVVAGGDVEVGDYVIRWIAWAIQHPDRQAEVALVLIGAKGVGKGTLVRVLERIFGAHAFQVTSREEVIGQFNGHLQDCVLFVADEAYWGGDKRCVGRLQGMITEPTFRLRGRASISSK